MCDSTWRSTFRWSTVTWTDRTTVTRGAGTSTDAVRLSAVGRFAYLVAARASIVLAVFSLRTARGQRSVESATTFGVAVRCAALPAAAAYATVGWEPSAWMPSGSTSTRTATIEGAGAVNEMAGARPATSTNAPARTGAIATRRDVRSVGAPSRRRWSRCSMRAAIWLWVTNAPGAVAAKEGTR